MSFKINGVEWVPDSATLHAQNLMNKINSLLQENNVTDESGNVIQLNANFANALYLLCLANANRFMVNDEKLSAAINSFNIELCDDQQIENLLPIAAVTRNPGSYSTLNVVVTASADGNAVIPAGTKLPVEDVFFIVDNDHTVSAGTSQIVATTCDTIGSITVLSGEVNAFQTTIANVDSVINLESSVPGVEPETSSQLRQRLIAGNTIKYTVDGCKGALEELTGVSYARVYFNYNTSATITLPGGVVLQPRTAYIVIHGNSDKIAETYAEFMSAPTQNSPIAQASASVVDVTITAGTGGSAVIPTGTTVTYGTYTFEIDEGITIAAGDSATKQFTCTVTGPVQVPAEAITELDQTISNVDTVKNIYSAIPGHDDPKHSQNWTTSSGQTVAIKYDDATEKNVFVKIVLKADAETGTQITNQLKRDLITASAQWMIGEEITSLKTGAPFVNCTYTDVAYTLVSEDNATWTNLVETDCNVIPRVSDGTIFVEQLS